MDVEEHSIGFGGRGWDDSTFYLAPDFSRRDLDIAAIGGTVGWSWPGSFPFILQTTKLSCSDLKIMVNSDAFEERGFKTHVPPVLAFGSGEALRDEVCVDLTCGLRDPGRVEDFSIENDI
jgi:hypothetical protein